MPLTSGATFGAYRIIEPLGRGGMAAVYKAYEAALDRYVALKVLPAEFMHDLAFADRFEREAKVVARLEHRHIVPIYTFGIEEDIPWMAMRLVLGGTLASLLSHGRLGPSRVLAILVESAQALDHAHSQGVLHRDVKPQNILLDEQGHVYLADFGIAKIVEGSGVVTKTGVLTGTPQYMSPEQWRAERVDHRTDIYALGIVAYEMLTGRVPFSADTPAAMMTKHLLDPIPIPAPGEVPEPLLRPLLKCLDKHPEARWPSASAFVTALGQGLGGALEEPAAPLADGARATIALSGAAAPSVNTESQAATPKNAITNMRPGKARARVAYGLGVLVLGIVAFIATRLVIAELSRRAAEAELTIAGTWHGTYSSGQLGYGRAVLALTQSDTIVSGTWSITPDAKTKYSFTEKPDGSVEKVKTWGGAGTVSGTRGTATPDGRSVTFPLTLSPSDPRTCELRATMTTTIFPAATPDGRMARHLLGEWVTFNCEVTATGGFILARVGL